MRCVVASSQTAVARLAVMCRASRTAPPVTADDQRRVWKELLCLFERARMTVMKEIICGIEIGEQRADKKAEREANSGGVSANGKLERRGNNGQSAMRTDAVRIDAHGRADAAQLLLLARSRLAHANAVLRDELGDLRRRCRRRRCATTALGRRHNGGRRADGALCHGAAQLGRRRFGRRFRGRFGTGRSRTRHRLVFVVVVSLPLFHFGVFFHTPTQNCTPSLSLL